MDPTVSLRVRQRAASTVYAIVSRDVSRLRADSEHVIQAIVQYIETHAIDWFMEYAAAHGTQYWSPAQLRKIAPGTTSTSTGGTYTKDELTRIAAIRTALSNTVETLSRRPTTFWSRNDVRVLRENPLWQQIIVNLQAAVDELTGGTSETATSTSSSSLSSSPSNAATTKNKKNTKASTAASTKSKSPISTNTAAGSSSSKPLSKQATAAAEWKAAKNAKKAGGSAAPVITRPSGSMFSIPTSDEKGSGGGTAPLGWRSSRLVATLHTLRTLLSFLDFSSRT
jgi:hypothetical protein